MYGLINIMNYDKLYPNPFLLTRDEMTIEIYQLPQFTNLDPPNESVKCICSFNEESGQILRSVKYVPLQCCFNCVRICITVKCVQILTHVHVQMLLYMLLYVNKCIQYIWKIVTTLSVKIEHQQILTIRILLMYSLPKVKKNIFKGRSTTT